MRKLMLLVGALTAVVGCRGKSNNGTGPSGGGGRKVVSVEVTAPSTSMYIGQNVQLTAVPRDAAGQAVAVPVAFSSNAATVVEVTGSGGLATGKAIGGGSVIATADGVTGQLALTVTEAPPGSVRIQPKSAGVQVGTSETLLAQVFDVIDRPMPQHAVAYSTSDAAVATVNQQGLVTGNSPGEAIIRAEFAHGEQLFSDQATVNVSSAPVASITLDPSNTSVFLSQSVQLTARVFDAGGTELSGRAFSFVSSNPTRASVSATGSVTGLQLGQVTITATSEGKSATATVTVSEVPVHSVTITPATPTVLSGGVLNLTATTRDAAGNILPNRSVVWEPASTANATLTSTGVNTVRFNAVGNRGHTKLTITATSEGKKGTTEVTILQAPVNSVAITTPSPKNFTLSESFTRAMSVTLRDEFGNSLTGRTVTWAMAASGNTATGSVAGSGYNATATATAVASPPGPSYARIVASSEGKADTSTMTVRRRVSSVVSSPLAVTVEVGLTVGVTVSLIATRGALPDSLICGPSTGACPGDRSITYSTNNSNVATVSGAGVVTGKQAGTATITITSEGRTTTVPVTVIAPVRAVIVSPNEATLARYTGVGSPAEVTLNVTLRDRLGNALTGRVIEYLTSNTAVATVHASSPTDSAPKVRAGTTAGSATITVRSEGVEATMKVIVQ